MRFFEILSLCHTIQIASESDQQNKGKYLGSPDEVCFINFCTK